MKSYRVSHFFIIIAAFVIVFGITGCSDEVNTPETDLSNLDLAVFDISDATDGISDATLDAQYTFNSPFGHRNFFRKDFSPGKGGRHLLQVLRRLNLSEAQKNEVKNFISAHHECIKGPLQDFRAIVQPILADANAKRKEIIDQFKAGTITREEAKVKIDFLNQATRELIQNDPALAPIKAAFCACKTNLFDNISSILTAEQKLIWDNWINNLSGPCSGN